MITLTIISLLIFSCYLAYSFKTFGITPDISSTFYLNRRKWLFPVMLSIVALLLLAPLMDLTTNQFKLFEFITVAGVLFTATAPAYREELVRDIHVFGALTAGMSAVAVVILSGFWWFAIGLVPLYLFVKKNRTYWVEVYLFAMIYARLLIG